MIRLRRCRFCISAEERGCCFAFQTEENAIDHLSRALAAINSDTAALSNIQMANQMKGRL